MNHKFSLTMFAVTLLIVFGLNRLLSPEPPKCHASTGTSSTPSATDTEGQ
jgi:hypothetical protein